MMRKDWLPTAGVLILTMGLTLAATFGVRSELMERARADVVSHGQIIRDELRDWLSVKRRSLLAGAGLMNVAPDVDRKQWNEFVSGLGLHAIQGLGVARLLDGDEAAFVAEQRAGGSPDFKVFPATRSGARVVIQYLAPENERNLVAIGYDMRSEPVRREALDRARSMGREALSGPVTLLQETDADAQVAVLLYLPLYRDGSLYGYVYAPIRIRTFLEDALGSLLKRYQEQLTIELIDSTGGAHSVLHRSIARGATVADLDWSDQLAAFGRDWQLNIAATESFLNNYDWRVVYRTLAFGTLISLLVSAVAGLLAMRRATLEVSAAALAAEVEARKQREEVIRLSNRELVHRVKNSLAIVTSIASQTARHTTTMPEFLSDFRLRVNALGRVHDMLRADQSYSPDFKSLIETSVAPYLVDDKGVLTVDGPAITVSQDQAVMYALLFNELATNATKYGAWSTARGTVEVNWRIEKSNSADILHVDWRERGGPIVKPPQRSGFGSTLLTFAVERTLRGQFEAEYPPEGARFTLRIPISGATVVSENSQEHANRRLASVDG